MSQITDEQFDAAVRGLHEALGGDGWAYTNYGKDELRSHRAELEAGVRAVANALSTPPVGAETGEPVATNSLADRMLRVANAADGSSEAAKTLLRLGAAALSASPRSDKANWDWVMVPKEPTEAVCRAGMERLGWWVVATPPETEFGSSGIIDPGISEEDATRIRGEMMEEFRAIYATILSTSPAVPNTVGEDKLWRTMDSAPLDGKHCILAVPEPGGFIYSVQGAYQDGRWNAVHRDNVQPIYWMPNIRLPAEWQHVHALTASLVSQGAGE